MTSAGNVTETQQASAYSSGGTPTYATESQDTYDSYGRILTSTNADGNKTTTGPPAVS